MLNREAPGKDPLCHRAKHDREELPLKSNSNQYRLFILSAIQHGASSAWCIVHKHRLHLFPIKYMFELSNSFSLGRQMKLNSNPFCMRFYRILLITPHALTSLFLPTSPSALNGAPGSRLGVRPVPK